MTKDEAKSYVNSISEIGINIMYNEKIRAVI